MVYESTQRETVSNFSDRLAAAVRRRRTAAVVGLDPVLERLPAEIGRGSDAASAAQALERFTRAVVDAVAEHVPVVKINSAFFEALYAPGVAAYYRCVAHARAAGLLVIGDIKRGDIGSTTELYARGHLGAPLFSDIDPAGIPDAVTLAGYLGRSGVQAFMKAGNSHGRGVFVLVRPSDPAADEIHEFGSERRLYEHLGELVQKWGDQPEYRGADGLSSVGAVVAPKDAASTQRLRQAMASVWWLVPGFGAQGGTADAVRPCFRPDGLGTLVNASRSVIYAFAGHAEKDWRGAVSRAAAEFAQQIREVSGL